MIILYESAPHPRLTSGCKDNLNSRLNSFFFIMTKTLLECPISIDLPLFKHLLRDCMLDFYSVPCVAHCLEHCNRIPVVSAQSSLARFVTGRDSFEMTYWSV